jgi:hypothetical protein
MIMKCSLVTALSISCAFGCVANAPVEDGRDDSFTSDAKADTGGIVDGSPEAQQVLALVNRATRELLDVEVGLAEDAAKNIAAYRLGDDELPDTLDDELFDTLVELDAVPFVGPVAFGKLLAFAQGHPARCDKADVDAYVAAVPALLTSAPRSVCVPSTLVNVPGGGQLAVCDNQQCDDGTFGCQLDLRLRDVTMHATDVIHDFANEPAFGLYLIQSWADGGGRVAARLKAADGTTTSCVAVVTWRSFQENYVELDDVDSVLVPTAFGGLAGTAADVIGCDPTIAPLIAESFQSRGPSGAPAAISASIRETVNGFTSSCD